jgi:hypothetical protein
VVGAVHSADLKLRAFATVEYSKMPLDKFTWNLTDIDVRGLPPTPALRRSVAKVKLGLFCALPELDAVV